MHLFLLKRVDKVDWDEHRGFIIRATSHIAARQIAACEAENEPREAWMDPERSTCVCLKESGDPGVLLRDFNAG